MNAAIDFDSILERRRQREEESADVRETALELAKAEVKLEQLLIWRRAFSKPGVLIPYATSFGTVTEQSISEAMSDVWLDEKVDALFMAMQSAPVEQLATARAAFQTAAALAYIAGQVDALAEHRVDFPHLYNDEVTQ